MTRLSFDQEAWARGITTMPLPPDVHRDIEDVLRARLVRLVRAGADVVVDFSFWSRAMREEYRELLRPLGVVPETVYLATDRATVLKRVAARAAHDGDDYAISTELAEFYFDHFEPPTAAEGPLTVIGSGLRSRCGAPRRAARSHPQGSGICRKRGSPGTAGTAWAIARVTACSETASASTAGTRGAPGFSTGSYCSAAGFGIECSGACTENPGGAN
jgi:hypothetical protein